MYDIENRIFDSIRDKLIPEVCAKCKKDGYTLTGVCSKCVKNREYNRDYIETHTFITDEEIKDYHSSNHKSIKSIPLRCEDERPFLYYGIELEWSFYDDSDLLEYDEYDDVRRAMTYSDVLTKFTQITDGMFVYEFDGSVEDGFELISRPISYKKWTEPEFVKKLKAGIDYLKDHGLILGQPDGNGMHVHLSKRFFKEQRNYDEAMADYKWVMDFYQDEMEPLCGREYTIYCQGKRKLVEQRIAPAYGDMNIKNLEVTFKKDHCIPVHDHSKNVNSDEHTLEVRVFKSTTDYKIILANIELTRAIAHAVREEKLYGQTLDEILHTKDNLYLDEHIRTVRNGQFKWKKEKLDLSRTLEQDMELKMVDGLIVRNVKKVEKKEDKVCA